MCLGSILQWVALADVHAQLPAANQAEQGSGRGQQVGRLGDVVEQARTRQEQRAATCQFDGRNCRRWTRGVAKAHHHAAPTQAVEGLQEGVLADRVVDDIGHATAGVRTHFGDDVVPAGEEHLVATLPARQLHLRLAADDAHDLGPEQASPLCQQ